MKELIAIALTFAAAGAAIAQPDINATIRINQPGVYGRINIGNVPPPALILPQPVIISQPRVIVERQPIYLYVPPVHQQQWGRYCGRYGACGQPVYFVRDDWIRERYEHEHSGRDNGRHRGWDKKEKREKYDKHDDEGRGRKGKGHKGGDRD